MRDYLHRGGAAQLADRIVKFWQKRGHDVGARIELASDWARGPIYGVRSDLVRGLPADQIRPTPPEPMVSLAAIEAMLARLAAGPEIPSFFTAGRAALGWSPPPLADRKGVFET